MQQLRFQKDNRPCLICSKQGARQAIERLPDGGILFVVAHGDGRICKWAEYSNLFQVKSKTRKSGPKYVKCPRCGDTGRLNWAHDLSARTDERAFTFKYEIVHEKIKGTWGKDKKQKYRRCQSFSREDRISILKQIGWHISDPPKRIHSSKSEVPDRYKEKDKIETYSAGIASVNRQKIVNSKIPSVNGAMDVYLGIDRRSDQKAIQKKVTFIKAHSNLNKNIVCCICNKNGTLRPRISNGRLVYYFAHGRVNGKEIRHHISSNNTAQMDYCVKHDMKNLHEEKNL